MARTSQISHVWGMIDRVEVGMLTTRFSGGLRARPLQARTDRDAGVIWFLTDERSDKDSEIHLQEDVGLVFVDGASRAWLSITARASITRDPVRAKMIWKLTDDMWWPGGADDPNVRVLRILPVTAELWNGPSGAFSTAFEFVKAKLTGEKPSLGENCKATVPMR